MKLYRGVLVASLLGLIRIAVAQPADPATPADAPVPASGTSPDPGGGDTPLEAAPDAAPPQPTPPPAAPGDRPQPSPGAGPAGEIPLRTPAPLGDDSDEALLGPCAEFEQRRIQLAEETKQKTVPIYDLINSGQRALRKRYYENAKDSFEQAVEVTRDLEDRWNRLATDLIQGVRLEERFTDQCTSIVSKSLSSAISMKDLLHEIYPLLGAAYYELGNFDQSAIELAKSVQINPDDPEAWRALGRAHLSAGENRKAIEAYARSVRIDPYQPETYYELAVAHAKDNNIRRGVFYLRRAISKGFRRFEEMDEDENLSNLRGDPDFEEIVYHGPGNPY